MTEQDRPERRTGRPPAGGRDYFVHESSYVDEGADVGSGTRIWHFSHVMSGAVIGEKCSIGQNVVISGKARLGRNVKVQNNVSIYDEVILEDDVFCGPSMVFTNVINPRSHIVRKHEYRQTLVKQGATIGANATILCGHTVGKYAFIGAGAVITRDVPDYALVYGNPARVQGYMCECGIRLDFGDDRAECHSCGARYRKSDDAVVPTE